MNNQPKQTTHSQDTMLSGIGVDDAFKEKVKQWRKRNWRISEQSIKNLEKSIGRGKNKFGSKIK